MDVKFKKLAELGVEEFEHIDGSLLEHLNNTKALLQQWEAPSDLQDAGLYHAVYGTDGFDEIMVSIKRRNEVADIIGKSAEEIVYQYCACDRKHFFANVGDDEPKFINRFSKESYYLTLEMLKDFCELTAANEIEIAIDNPAFLAEHGSGLLSIFSKMSPYLSLKAQAKVMEVFGECNA